MKRIIFTEEAEAFADSMDFLSQKKLARMVTILESQGFLRAPMAEKVSDNLFAIRIMTAANNRFFYCYDDGITIYVISGYTKKSAHIPTKELNRAIAIKKGLGL